MLGHALLLGPYASLETLNEVDKVLDGAVAQVLNPLKGGFKEAVGHFIPGKEILLDQIPEWEPVLSVAKDMNREELGGNNKCNLCSKPSPIPGK